MVMQSSALALIGRVWQRRRRARISKGVAERGIAKAKFGTAAATHSIM